ncbi:DEAD/DEAH box helicase [Clostridium chauvoei]|uniref:DEAD/DEAH box helicase n=1 Tax=Clostridium chauvoei TaxID=46867 RepID=UPI001C860C53|nr:DEAD/DEAH box helicase [Clostridium chauvoei]MBX7403621.1 DEAD/DEAH box helicase [Clostridium chauvoei]
MRKALEDLITTSTVKDLNEIDMKEIIEEQYFVKNKLIVNSKKGDLLKELKLSLQKCKNFYFSVAFINFSGVQLLLDSFKELEERGVKGKIITSTYLNFTEPKALERLKGFNNIDLKIFIADNENGFHTKAYIFENEENYKIIIGSSNITQRALKSNVEWNVMVISKKETEFVQEVLDEFNYLWGETCFIDNEFLDKYKSFINTIKQGENKNLINFNDYKIIKPNLMQEKALENLKRLRSFKENRALVIAATGTGKTYMSAFDVMNFNPKKLLFIVHREDILRSAAKTYISLCKNKNIKIGFYTGNIKDESVEYLFATSQTMERHLKNFKRDEFQYIIIDEAHHSTSPTYEKILSYFSPKFLLGVTATPERCDDGNIFEVFDNNVALEIRLHEALENDLIVPFHYFGITDIESCNLDKVNLDNISEVSKKLMINKRVDFIIEKMNFYGFDGEYQKTIGFCISKEHANYMATEFNKYGIESISLTGDDSINKREEVIKRIQDNNDPLKVIFTVDIFNEGVDIPAINQILMLRPTNSPIVFIQQLGRGLRKYSDKNFLTVIDFIGNHNKAFLIALALKGSRYYDKDSLKVAVSTEFIDIPGCTNIQMDRISKERILEQLNTENFNSLKYLKDEYNEFKALIGGKIPYSLMEYIKYDGAPDPLKFINYQKTYQGFLAKVEKNSSIEEVLIDKEFFNILKEFSNKLPIKRPYEFAIIKYLISHSNITVEIAIGQISKYLDSVNKNTILHSFKTLNQDFYDSAQKNNNIKLFNYENNTLIKLLPFERILQNKQYRCIIEDLINYGLVRYEKQFGSKNYGNPFLKLYEQYQMVDIALLSNYEKIHSSFRGSGLITNGREYFLFVDLHKEKSIKESINYKDEFIDNKNFQWQTPNSTSKSSERGKNIIFNKEREINLHLFVRKYKEIDKVTQSYIYIGKSNSINYKGEKPITINLELENKVPENLYIELTKKV